MASERDVTPMRNSSFASAHSIRPHMRGADMGNGKRDGDQLNFQVTANFAMGNADRFRWRCAFEKASEILCNATEGGLRFGKVFVTNDGAGITNAEYVLSDTGITSIGTRGEFGQPGKAVRLVPDAQREVLSLVHELGHHVWNLDEEYAFTLFEGIDTERTLPVGHGNLIIPLDNSIAGRPDGDFASARTYLFLNDALERRNVVSKVGATVTVDVAFSDNPQNASPETVGFEWDAECTGDKTTGACIMEFSRHHAGTMDPNCIWAPDPNAVTEFCTATNHDPNEDTAQQGSHGESCWATLTAHAGYTDLAAITPVGAAETTLPAGCTDPDWIVLEPNPRFALILDRSGSMNRNAGSRLEGVKTGAAYWLEVAAVEDDRLTIIWYNTTISKPLGLTDFSTLSDQEVQDLVDDIDVQTATGGTNIRDALLEGVAELLSPPGTPAAVQASLLMTDGAHNSPVNTSMQEAVLSYQAANTNIYTLGVGSGAELDIAGLETLANATGGSAMTEAEGADAFEIRARMMEINALIRGGLISSLVDIVPDAPRETDISFEEDVPVEERPPLEEILANVGASWPPDPNNVGGLGRGRITIARHEVERGAEAAIFSLAFERPMKLWLYLVDPDGREVAHNPPGVTVVASDHQFEFAKVIEPIPGVWTIIGLRPQPGGSGRAQAITGVQNRQLAVTARAWSPGNDCPVKVTATARFRESLSGISMKASVWNMSGRRFSIQMHDVQGDGSYVGYFDLAPGLYRGRVDIRSSGNAIMANLDHVVVHAIQSEIGSPRVGNPSFHRSHPISFVVGTIDEPGTEEVEEIGCRTGTSK